MPDIGSVGQGAASGAMTGAALGPWGALIGGVAGGAMSFALGGEAEAAKKRAADEAIRRFDISSETQLAEGQARAAASGVVPGASSMALHLSNMSQEFHRQRQLAVDDADKALQLGNLSNTFGLLSTVGGSLFKFGESNNWWQAKPAALTGAPATGAPSAG